MFSPTIWIRCPKLIQLNFLNIRNQKLIIEAIDTCWLPTDDYTIVVRVNSMFVNTTLYHRCTLLCAYVSLAFCLSHSLVGTLHRHLQSSLHLLIHTLIHICRSRDRWFSKKYSTLHSSSSPPRICYRYHASDSNVQLSTA